MTDFSTVLPYIGKRHSFDRRLFQLYGTHLNLSKLYEEEVKLPVDRGRHTSDRVSKLYFVMSSIRTGDDNNLSPVSTSGVFIWNRFHYSWSNGPTIIGTVVTCIAVRRYIRRVLYFIILNQCVDSDHDGQQSGRKGRLTWPRHRNRPSTIAIQGRVFSFSTNEVPFDYQNHNVCILSTRVMSIIY